MTLKPDGSDRIKHMPRQAIVIGVITLTVLLIGMSIWLLYGKGLSFGISGPGHAATTPTPIQTKVPTTTHDDTSVSPLIFGTNMALFDSNDQLLNSGTTRATLQQLHVRIIRMPVRAGLSETTEIQAAQTIKSMGATPLIILRGQVDKNVLADDIRIINDMNSIFGNSIVYYEYGNEEDLLGVPVDPYTASWNSIVPQLKRVAQNGHFIGPVNYKYDHGYLATFLQNAQPRPDEISWHEYTCDDHAPADECISKIDLWTSHIADARATMVNIIGNALPIMITEWNYSPNAVPNDGKNNDSTFMSTWTAKALQTLAANRIFASMQYSCTNTAIPLVSDNGSITTQGSMLQTQYTNIIVSGQQTAATNQTPPATGTKGNGNGGTGEQIRQSLMDRFPHRDGTQF